MLVSWWLSEVQWIDPGIETTWWPLPWDPWVEAMFRVYVSFWDGIWCNHRYRSWYNDSGHSLYIYVNMYTYVYIYIYTYTYIHIYIHIYVCMICDNITRNLGDVWWFNLYILLWFGEFNFRDRFDLFMTVFISWWRMDITTLLHRSSRDFLVVIGAQNASSILAGTAFKPTCRRIGKNGSDFPSFSGVHMLPFIVPRQVHFLVAQVPSHLWNRPFPFLQKS